MKLVAISNLNDETFSEILICEKIYNEEIAKIFQNILNSVLSDDEARIFYDIKEDDYKLYRYQP